MSVPVKSGPQKPGLTCNKPQHRSHRSHRVDYKSVKLTAEKSTPGRTNVFLQLKSTEHIRPQWTPIKPLKITFTGEEGNQGNVV